jgi:hypothetical protein
MISAHPNFFFHAESQLTRIYWTYVGDVVNDYITSVTTYPECIAGQPMIQKKERKKDPTIQPPTTLKPAGATLPRAILDYFGYKKSKIALGGVTRPGSSNATSGFPTRAIEFQNKIRVSYACHPRWPSGTLRHLMAMCPGRNAANP